MYTDVERLWLVFCDFGLLRSDVSLRSVVLYVVKSSDFGLEMGKGMCRCFLTTEDLEKRRGENELLISVNSSEAGG